LEGMSAGADDYLTKPVDSFAVQTRLIAAARVTGLHTRLALTQAELERANGELRERSLTDGLTGLGNRRRMDEEIAHTHARALRVGRTYGVALFDIDHFKLYNDRYGARRRRRDAPAGRRLHRPGGPRRGVRLPLRR